MYYICKQSVSLWKEYTLVCLIHSLDISKPEFMTPEHFHFTHEDSEAHTEKVTCSESQR